MFSESGLKHPTRLKVQRAIAKFLGLDLADRKAAVLAQIVLRLTDDAWKERLGTVAKDLLAELDRMFSKRPDLAVDPDVLAFLSLRARLREALSDHHDCAALGCSPNLVHYHHFWHIHREYVPDCQPCRNRREMLLEAAKESANRIREGRKQ